ncbi:hypothetical protein KTU01_37170 [Kocuria turfanensis]|uniref:Helix-turn-helix domain-containing protein n=1 Tax=Kocuria turfanensis TaxID=388357 RepID=A0A512IIR0_9MICC|nr:hypothetical protein KTU01_37170 [Kocuria turfanensis]
MRVEHEQSKAVVQRAVPKGCQLAKHVVAWRRAVLEHPSLELIRADARANVLAVVEIICSQQNPASRTWRTTWDWVAAKIDRSRSTVARVIRHLRDCGLLAVVATGRSAGRTPRSTGRAQGEAPVYALIHNTVQPAMEPVELTDTPVPTKWESLSPHAREEVSPKDAAAPRPTRKRAAQRREVVAALSRRTASLWPRHATTEPLTGRMTRRARKETQRAAALELQHEAIVLRQLTTAHVVSVLRPFFEAGWTIADVLTALDWTPQGTRYGFLTVEGIENPGAWLTARMRAWTHPDGTPMRSRDQRVAAEAAQRRAAARAAAERSAARLAASAAVPASAPEPGPRRPFRQRWAAQIAAGQNQAAGAASAP